MITILIGNQKGGVGKTTLCVELASFLGQKYRTLGIDLDGQGHFGKFSGAKMFEESQNGKIKETVNILNVLEGEADMKEAVQHIEQKKFINKVVQNMLISEKKKELSLKKDKIDEKVSNKREGKRLKDALDKEYQSIVKEIKKEVYETESDTPGFDIIPASQKIFKAEKIFVDFDDIFKLAEALEQIEDDYDFTIIDIGPSRSILQSMSILAADYIIIPSDREEGGMDGITQMAIDLKQFKEKGLTEAEILGIFLIRSERQVVQGMIEEDITKITDAFNIPIFTSFTKNSYLPKEARTARMSVGEYKPNSPMAIDYYNFYLEVLEKIEKHERIK